MMTADTRKKQGISISRTFFRWLLIIFVIGFLTSMTFTWIHQNRISRDNALALLQINVQDVKKDITDASDRNLLQITRQIAVEIDSGSPVNDDKLQQMLDFYDVAEINIVDDSGVIIMSTMPTFLNYNMKNGSQSSEFLALLNGSENEHVQKYQPTSFDSALSRKYAAVKLRSGGFVQVGYNGEQFRADIRQDVVDAAKNRHVGQNGCIIIASEDWSITSDRFGLEGKNLAETGIWIDVDRMPQNKIFHTKVYGLPCSCMYIFSEGYYIISVLPESEIIRERNSSLQDISVIEILIFLLLFTVIYMLIKRRVVLNLKKVNQSLAEITDGNLDVVVDVRSNKEFSALSDDINSTVTTLKEYIVAAAARIDTELAFAKSIQESSLPSVFPPYPDRTEFSLFASMDTAREVGGDFYDFYLLDENRLAFLIADVSGKGIPAAMFMMTSKTLLRDYAERGDNPEEVFFNANKKLCAGNDADMFVTVWMGFLETDTGLLHFVNAGHNPPVIIRNKKASFISQNSNLMLAMLDDVPYREQTLQLEPGDILYLYTDGVTEASRKDEKRYGNDRLLRHLSVDFGAGEEACRNVCVSVRKSVDDFVEGEVQFDDITQVCLFYAGTSPKSGKSGILTEQMTFPADTDSLNEILLFVNKLLDDVSCPEKEKKQFGMAVEEVFVNIASYAYGGGNGTAEIRLTVGAEPGFAEVCISDSGFSYNPLDNPDPDLAMDVERRQHGGFGIFMVKKTMDIVTYERKDGKNMLTFRKTWNRM